MKRMTSLLPMANFTASGFSNYQSLRGIRFVNIKWVRPKKESIFHPNSTGDLSPMPDFNNHFRLGYQKSEELKTANENVKKIFSIKNLLPRHKLAVYTQYLVDKVKKNQYDTTSDEVKIAKMTAKIRFFQPIILSYTRNGSLIMRIKEVIDARQKKLKILRLKDYKRFEWLLNQLDLVYKPIPLTDREITRKKSLSLLAKLKAAEVKEKKIANLKEAFDKQKIPFLEKKIEKLNWIRELEEKYNLPRTVTDTDIEACRKKIERVKIDIDDRISIGYARKIHPYFIEPYNEKLLLQKEQKNVEEYNKKKNEENSESIAA